MSKSSDAWAMLEAIPLERRLDVMEDLVPGYRFTTEIVFYFIDGVTDKGYETIKKAYEETR